MTTSGEWTALRKALLAKAKEWRRRERFAGSPDEACVYPFLAEELEALAAAAPAPPAAPCLCVKRGEWRQECPEHGKNASPGTVTMPNGIAAPPPQDGQGAELLGPQRGGSSSDLADSSNPGTVKADEILMRIAQRYENCKVNIYPDMPYLTPVEAVLRCAQEEGFRLTSIVPEAVAGNASAPVGEPSATVVSANESAVIPLDKLSEEWDRLDRYYSQLADVAAGAGYDKGSFIGKSIGFSVCAAQLRAALPASSGMGSGQPSGMGEPRVRQGREQVLLMLSDDLAKEIREELESHDAAMATPSPSNTLVAKEANAEVVQKEVGEGLREAAIYQTTDVIWKRLYKFSTGQDFPAGEIVSPGQQGIIAQEIRKLLAALAAPAPKPAPPAEPKLLQLIEELTLTVEFYLKREINSPSNHQEFAREASEKLDKWYELTAAVRRAAERKPPR